MGKGSYPKLGGFEGLRVLPELSQYKKVFDFADFGDWGWAVLG
jgi:hypothetical protein